jgi:CRP-like cAMP-binding protein
MPRNGTGNALLDGLPREEYDRLRPRLQAVDMAVRDQIYEVDEPITHVYFPVGCVMSLVTEMHDGRAVEVATVGREGMVGLPVFLRTSSTSAHHAFTQVAGPSYRMGAEHLIAMLDPASGLFALLQRYTQALFSQIAVASACNRLHLIEQRCARWLLMTHDRVDGDRYALTQEFLAQMLGVQRTSVNEVAQRLQDAGLIAYRNGTVDIVDRAGLEAASCECYQRIRVEFDRLLSASSVT